MSIIIIALQYLLKQHNRNTNLNHEIHLLVHLEKSTHSHAQGVASNFTPNYILNICYLQTTYTYLKYISYKFYCFTHIYLYAYWKANYILHTLAFKREFHTITYSFRKIIIHTLLGISCPLYLPIYTHYCKVFSMLPLCKVSNMGQPKFK